jgi:hypothetical protein
MRPFPTVSLPVLCALFFALPGRAQEAVQLKRTVLFDPGHAMAGPQEIAQLMRYIDSVAKGGSLTIFVEGNSDGLGNYQRNIILSRKRAEFIRRQLLTLVDPGSRVIVHYFGPNRPVANNATSAGRRMNRRVDIFVSRPPGGREDAVIDRQLIVDKIHPVTELYARLSTAPEKFCVDWRRDTVLRCRQGSIIYVKANSLVPGPGCDSACVTFTVKEDFRCSDMLLDNLSTTSNGDMLQTRGMIYTDVVDCAGHELELQTGKDLVVLLPTDSVNPAARIFKGRRDRDSVMNWTIDSNALLKDFSLAQLDICSDFICGNKLQPTPCPPCPFFFCRIGRVGKAAKGLFSKEQRAENTAFRNCRQAAGMPAKPGLNPDLVPRCSELDSLFRRYGVHDLSSLVRAINKPLMDSFNVKTVGELQDTLKKIKTREIELSYANKRISFDDFKYYVFNERQLGWSNCDLFAGIGRFDRITVKTNLEIYPNIDCKLIFKKRRIIMPPTRETGRYEFRGVPKNEPAIIVALKNEGSIFYVAIKEISTGSRPVDLDWKELPIDELKEELRKLDE